MSAAHLLNATESSVSSGAAVRSGGHAGQSVWSMLVAPPKLITCDIFDTVLLRRPISEPKRQWMASARIAQRFPSLRCSVLDLYQARRLAQTLAYRANQLGSSGRDVPIRQILQHQARLVGLPADSVEALVDIELDVEARSLYPQRTLLARLAGARDRKARVVAVSDTPLSASDLSRLLHRVADKVPFDRIYTSADCGGCKHNCRLFQYVQQAEAVEGKDICHIGDNSHSDGRMASLAGQHAFLRRRSFSYDLLRLGDAALFRTGVAMQQGIRRRTQRGTLAELPPQVLRGSVLGPLVAQYCLRLWLYLSNAAQGGEAVALFCARGGIGQRIAFEKFLLRTGLSSPVRRENLLVSRVIAARGAVLSRSPAAADALAYEFQGDSLRLAAEALAGRSLDLGAAWDQPFDGQLFFDLLQQDPAAHLLRSILSEQNTRFQEHLDARIGSAKRVILCDTGLYGSTIRLLQAARPDVHFELLLLARSNYRAGDASHFKQTVGLLSEVDHYAMHEPASIVLRYWHLIELLFELAVPSATTFPCTSSLQTLSDDFESTSFHKVKHLAGTSLLGVCDYLDGLSKENFFSRLNAETPEAWQRLRAIVIQPRQADADLWSTGSRGRDFGRTETFESIAPPRDASFAGRLRAVRSSRWKEGAIARHFGRYRAPAQWLLESAYLARSARHLVLGLVRRSPAQQA